jgi:hypothetical protein
MVLRSSSSIRKHSGALMSSRLMPPKVGSNNWQVRMISRGSSVASSMSNTSISAKRLNSTPLPSITGLPASAPMFPRPEHRRAVADHAHQVALRRVGVGERWIALDFEAGHRDAGRIGQAQIALRAARLGGDHRDLAGRGFRMVFESVFRTDRHRSTPFRERWDRPSSFVVCRGRTDHRLSWSVRVGNGTPRDTRQNAIVRPTWFGATSLRVRAS